MDDVRVEHSYNPCKPLRAVEPSGSEPRQQLSRHDLACLEWPEPDHADAGMAMRRAATGEPRPERDIPKVGMDVIVVLRRKEVQVPALVGDERGPSRRMHAVGKTDEQHSHDG